VYQAGVGGLLSLVAIHTTGRDMASWTALNNHPTLAASRMLLLTDGTVMIQAECSNTWWRLTRDGSGSDINTSWTLPDMASTLQYYATAALADGRVVVGGEYSDAGGDTDCCEICIRARTPGPASAIRVGASWAMRRVDQAGRQLDRPTRVVHQARVYPERVYPRCGAA
jgi:hypothetical protein